MPKDAGMPAVRIGVDRVLEPLPAAYVLWKKLPTFMPPFASRLLASPCHHVGEGQFRLLAPMFRCPGFPCEGALGAPGAN